MGYNIKRLAVHPPRNAGFCRINAPENEQTLKDALSSKGINGLTAILLGPL
jgi:hypothetical protein